MEKETEFIVTCPQCNNPVIIEKLNCGIFRHGILISNGRPVSPHSSKDKCDELIRKNLIYGCGKPFQIIKKGDVFMISICEYI